MFASNGLSGPPCGMPWLRLFPLALFLHWRSQVVAYEFQDSLVFDFLADFRHQDVVIDFVKERTDVYVHYPRFAFLDVATGRPDRVMRASLRPISVAVTECRVEDRTQHLAYRLLDDSVLNSRDAQDSFPTLWFSVSLCLGSLQVGSWLI